MKARPSRQTLKIPRILVVEGDATMKPLFEYILSELHPLGELEWARTAEDAEQLIAKNHKAHTPFDIVISEILLAGSISGVDIWRKYQGSSSNFILMSSMAPGRIFEFLRKNEVAPFYMQKPLDPLEVTETLKVMLEYPDLY
jgi:DNA-binding response OmpR family regulator